MGADAGLGGAGRFELAADRVYNSAIRDRIRC
jgi:hypothetical protein